MRRGEACLIGYGFQERCTKRKKKGTPPDPEKGTLKEGGDEKDDEKG